MLKDGDKGVILQRDKQTYAVAPHLPCGLVTPAILRKLADVAEKHHVQALKVTSAARIALVGLREDQVDAVWADLGMDPGAAVGLCVRSVKACPGTTFCKRGLQDSLAVGLELDRKYHGAPLPGKMKLGVSGCPNQCAETGFKDIGLVGTARGWKVLVGGNGGGNPRIAQTIAEDLPIDQAMTLVDKVVGFFKDNAKPHERLGRVIERLGLDALKEATSR
jgi:NAD(P)H-nitrite reductase large subunit